jgi:hypothetical protein
MNKAEVKEVLNYLSQLAIRYEKEGQESDTERIIDIKNRKSGRCG